MEYIKIANNKGYYRLNNSEDWTEIDQISTEHLMIILEEALKEGFEMQEFDEELLKNPAHNIIYKNIYSKLFDVVSNKSMFEDNIENMYKDALEKYKSQHNEEE